MITDRARRRIQVVACLPFLLCCLAIASAGAPARNASAQNNNDAAKKDYALIFGTVWGPDSRPVAGVPVTIRRASGKKLKWDLVSDHSGEFAQRVPVGAQDYIVQAEIKTPKGQPRPAVTVHIDNNERKDIGLHLTEQMLTKK